MTNQLVVVTKIVEGKPPEKMAILVNNIFQIRPVFTDMPAIPAAPAIPAVPEVRATPEKPAVLDGAGNVVTPEVPANPGSPAVPAVPAVAAKPAQRAETGAEIDFQNGKIVVAETLAQIISQAG
jgi:hypothetical protein